VVRTGKSRGTDFTGEPRRMTRPGRHRWAVGRRAILAESRLAAIVDASDDAIVSQTLAGVIVSWNPGAERMYGYPASAVVGKPVSMLATRGLTDVMPEVLRRVRLGERLEHYDTVHARRDGALIDVSVTVSAVLDEIGAVIGAATIARDVTTPRTAERAVRAAEEKYRTMFENAREGIFYTTPDSNAIRANPALARLLGYSSAEEFLNDPRHLLGSWKRQQKDELWPHLEGEGGGGDFEMEGRRRDGTKIWVSGTVAAVRDGSGKAVAYQGTLLDITDRKLSETALQVSDQAERANQAKTDFLSRLSHELRTPLTAILGFGQLLEQDRQSPAEKSEAIEAILTAGRHLLALINESVDIARIEGGHLAFRVEPVLLAEVIEEALVLMAPTAQRQAITIDVVPGEAGCRVIADRGRLVQVLLNLLSNAVKYNREGGQIVVASVVHDAMATVCVSDTGPGIADDLQDRIFVAFDRLGAEGGNVEGTGLGLALSLQLVTGMGGTLTAQSEVRQGSRFSVTLPIPTRPAAPSARELSPNGRRRS
jgi:PAS domain S-box-containing protein